MAEERVTINELRRQIARQTGIEEAHVGAFLTELFSTIVEGLKTDKSVRINGLGAFKLQWNEPRKSVNVSTGETIMLEGYSKLVFAPEPAVRERVNEPFAHLEAMMVDANGVPVEKPEPINPMDKLAEQADEIKGLLEDINGEEKVAEPQPVVEEKPAEPEEIAEPIKLPEEKIAEPIELSEEKIEQQPKQTKERRPFRPWLVALITMLVLLFMLTGAFFFLQYKIETWADMLNGKVNAAQTEEEFWEEIEAAEQADNQETLVVENDSIEPSATEDNTKEPEDTAPVAFSYDAPRIYSNIQAIETVNEGSRLTWIAKKHYGKKELWVYIYEANRNQLRNPEQLNVGMRLIIPQLPEELSDLSRPEAAKLAKELHDEYVH